MNPTTELDPRFSDPDTEATSWDDARRVLQSAQLGWLSTVRADGRPHVTPLVPVWHDDAVHFTTGPEEQKTRNLSFNRQVVLTTGCCECQEGLDMMVEGEAFRITDPETLRGLAAAWQTKWDGFWKFEVTGEGFLNDVGGVSFVFRIEPRKVLAFGKGTFTHTRHVFGPD